MFIVLHIDSRILQATNHRLTQRKVGEPFHKPSIVTIKFSPSTSSPVDPSFSTELKQVSIVMYPLV